MTTVTLNLFPARIPIGKARAADVAAALAAGRDVEIKSSPEFERALASLFLRVGGPTAPSNTELDASADTSMDSAAVGALGGQFATFVRDAAMAGLEAQNAALRTRVADLEHGLAGVYEMAAALGDMRRRVADLEHAAAMGERPTDWEHPGKIGSGAANTGEFTTLSVSGAVRLNETSAQTLIGRTATSAFTSNGILQVRENTNEFVVSIANAASKEWSLAVRASGMYFRNVTDAVSPMSFDNSGNVNYSRQMVSSVATGTAPLVVVSTTKVANLNVDLLDGADWASPAAIGSTTPAAATFTALSTNGTADAIFGSNTTNSSVNVLGSNAGVAGGTAVVVRNNGTSIISFGNKSSILGTAYDATPYIFGNAQIEFSQGIKLPGQMESTVATGTAPLLVASTTKVANLNADLLDGSDWTAPPAIGSVTPAAATFTSVSYSGQLTSTVATGTAPLVVTSTTKVANLNVDLLDGADWASPAALGTTTPAAATFTALTTNGTANVNLGTDSTNSTVNVRGSNSGTNGGTGVSIRNNNVAILNLGNKSAVNGGAYDATPYILGNATIEVGSAMKFLSTVGFNNTNPIAKPTVSGSRAGNAALASLLTALSNYGLVTDSSTA